MPKSGINHGGRRIKSGKKPQALADKIASGNKALILETTVFENVADLKGEDMPKPDDYLKAKQKDGKPLGADKIYEETWQWLKERRCEKFVNTRLIESYSQAFARYIQCENAITEYGFLGKHPTTGGAIANPFVQMSLSFQKQANLLWYEIFDIVKQNCTTSYIQTPQDDVMERLLTARKGK